MPEQSHQSKQLVDDSGLDSLDLSPEELIWLSTDTSADHLQETSQWEQMYAATTSSGTLKRKQQDSVPVTPFQQMPESNLRARCMDNDPSSLIEEASGRSSPPCKKRLGSADMNSETSSSGSSRPVGSIGQLRTQTSIASKLNCTDHQSRSQDASEGIRFPALIGEMTAIGIAMCRGTGIIRTGDRVLLSRTSPTVQHGKSTHARHYASNLHAKDNTIVRIYRKDGKEVGKLSSEYALFVKTLLDQELCQFEGTIVYTKDCISMLDEIILTLHVSLVREAFQVTDPHRMGVADTESADAIARVRSRKLALASIIQRVGIDLGVSTNSIQETSQPHGSNANLTDNAQVSGSDLAMVYKRASLLENVVGSMQPSPGMLVELHDYQATALAFMYAKENRAEMDLTGISPLWTTLSTTDGNKFYYNKYSGELSLQAPKELHCSGGILADEMGLGKTIEMLALIHSSRQKLDAVSKKLGEKRSSHATLVVCPVNILSQWRDEVRRVFAPGVIDVDVYYGSERILADRFMYAKKTSPHIIVTTYGTLASDFAKASGDSPLFAIEWHRVVLDEAHYIKERTTKAAKAACGLSAVNRWTVTGTPIVNRLDDIYSLIHFLRVEPWCQFSFWNSFVTVPFDKRDSSALEIVQTILEPLIIRRMKNMRNKDGDLIVKLLPKTIDITYLDFPSDELEIYTSLANHSRQRLMDLKIIGKADYMHVFQLLSRMRQMCDHPLLIKMRSEADATINASALNMSLEDLIRNYSAQDTSAEFSAEIASTIASSSSRECPICFEINVGSVVFPCLHTICLPCIDDLIEKRAERGEEAVLCPMCRNPCAESELMRMLDNQTPEKTNQTTNVVSSDVQLQPIRFRSSAKLNALLKDLLAIRSSDQSIKSVVFSQWTSMLGLVEVSLKQHNITFVRMDGSLSQRAREKVLNSFNTDKDTTILLATLRSTGVGLNLTVASRVFMLDPWWNESVELQAIDRVHRIGQTRHVYVTRYIMRDSVEEKMLAIQHRKSQLAGAITSSELQKTQLDELMTLFD
ncbi:hypothetical protein BASA60_008004 [Batrachochytrium salamandrivorans]|nr:hypothetical protein BASA60_008004 [Batrachochytrium salamandrivorans]